MRKFRIAGIAAIAAVLLLIAEIAIVKNASQYSSDISVVYSAQKIPSGALVSQEMLDLISIPSKMAHKYSVTSLDSLVGMVSTEDIEKGEMILTTRLKQAGTEDSLLSISTDSRLLTIEFRADQANGWLLKEEQYVDIIYIPNLSTQKEVGVKRFENIRIAAFIDGKGNVINSNAIDAIPKYICFEVERGQDEFLIEAKSKGRLEISVPPGSYAQLEK